MKSLAAATLALLGALTLAPATAAAQEGKIHLLHLVVGDGGRVDALRLEGADKGNQITLASGALLTLNADGSYDYDPNGQFETLGVGQTDTDSFSYTLSDGQGGTDTATVTITITGTNDGPQAVADTGTTAEGAVLNVAAGSGVLTNDTDLDADTLAVTLDPPRNTGDVFDVAWVNGGSGDQLTGDEGGRACARYPAARAHRGAT